MTAMIGRQLRAVVGEMFVENTVGHKKAEFEFMMDDQQIAVGAHGRVSFFPYSHQPSMDELPSPLLKSRIPKKTILLDHKS